MSWPLVKTLHTPILCTRVQFLTLLLSFSLSVALFGWLSAAAAAFFSPSLYIHLRFPYLFSPINIMNSHGYFAGRIDLSFRFVTVVVVMVVVAVLSLFYIIFNGTCVCVFHSPTHSLSFVTFNL